MINKLYGDGINDDTAAIQELIDTAENELVLPKPEKRYLISKPLEIPSNFKLVLPRFAEIKLAANSNCVMLRNKHTRNIPEDYNGRFLSYIESCKGSETTKNIEIVGGIWNFNNMEQAPNPLQVREPKIPEFWGFGMIFYNVVGLKISSLTLKDPSNFAVTLDTVTDFEVENIFFDYNKGNPIPINMDGIHCNGNCHNGTIKNLKGACYDDLIALNADEGTRGPITNVTIDGIYAETCHSAVRLLSAHQKVENIHISNVYGTYFQYCIGLTKNASNGQIDGGYDNIVIDNVYASKANQVYTYPWQGEWQYPFIIIEGETLVKNIKISNLHRKEKTIPIETICIYGDSIVENLVLENVTVENLTGEKYPFIKNYGTIKNLVMHDTSYKGRIKNCDNGILETMSY